MAKRILSTADDALELLALCSDDNTAETLEIEIGEHLGSLLIEIDGPRYHASVPAELARGMWELQQELYRASAFALYGAYDQRKLTDEQRARFELVFEVSAGCTKLDARIDKFIDGLMECIREMDSATKKRLVLAVVAMLITGWVISAGIEGKTSAFTKSVESEEKVEIEKLRTRQFEILAEAVKQDPRAKAFAQALDEGTRAVLRSSPDAREIVVGRQRFDADAIREAGRRAPRVKSTAEVIQEEFQVFETNTRHSGSTKYRLARRDGTEFRVTVDHEDFTSDELARLWIAAKDRKAITLEVNLTISRGNVKSAQIAQILSSGNP